MSGGYVGPIGLTEDNLAEQPALEWFRKLGYEAAFGPDISPGGARPERKSFRKVTTMDKPQEAVWQQPC